MMRKSGNSSRDDKSQLVILKLIEYIARYKQRCALVEKEKDDCIRAKDAVIEKLSSAVEADHTIMSDLDVAVQDEVGVIDALKSSLQVKEADVEELRLAVQAKEEEVEELRLAMQAKDAQLAEVNEHIQIVNAQLAELNLAGKIKDQQILDRNQEILKIQNEKTRITDSITWRLARKVHRIVDHIFPLNTKRRLITKRLLLNLAHPRKLISNLSFHHLKTYFRYLNAMGPVKFEDFLTSKMSRLSVAKPDVISNDAPGDTEEIAGDSTKGPPGSNSDSRLASFLEYSQSRLAFPACDNPDVSIAILTYNNVASTYDCLLSIIANTRLPYEVIIVDNASTDDTPVLLNRLDNVKIEFNTSNLGFVDGCNMAARAAAGDYILFLNNDTIVTEGWLDHLYRVIKEYPGCGVAGSKIMRLDGTLQEAGSIIWSDGTAMGYGRDDDPQKPQYCYLREVDYCSACCFMVRRDLFEKIGGFDKRYGMAYYEDSDFCMSVWKEGYRVVYQPASVIYHLEYKGSSQEQAKLLMDQNRTLFAEKWHDELEKKSRNTAANILEARDRRPGARVLVVDDCIPASRLGSGFPRAVQMLKDIAGLGYKVTFFPVNNAEPIQPDTAIWQQSGIEVIFGDNPKLAEFLAERKGYYDMVIISRPHNMRNNIDVIKKCCPDAVIIYDAEAVFAIREALKADVEAMPMDRGDVDRMVNEEIALISRADMAITVSEEEKKIICSKNESLDIEVWGHPVTVIPSQAEFKDRADILFVGSFIAGAGSPNEDSVVYFANEIFPAVHKKLRCRLHVVGSYPTAAVLNLSSDVIRVEGYVEDIIPYYEQCKIFIAPTRYAAGIPLKLIEAMGCGIPAVVTPLIAGQLGLADGKEVLVAGDRETFIERIEELYLSESLWKDIQSRAIAYIRDNCDPDKMKEKLQEILSKASCK